MTIQIVVFLLGLFGVPIALLLGGHRLRRRSPRAHRIFWGAVIGHCIAATLAIIWAMIPPEAWTSEEKARGFIGLWSLLLFPVVGALIGASIRRSQTR